MEDRANTIWKQAKETIRESLSSSTYEIWFDKADAVGMDDNTFLLSVPNDFAKSRIENRYLPLIEDSLQEVVGEEVPVRLVVSQGPAYGSATADAAPAIPVPVVHEGGRRDGGMRSSPVFPNPKYNFDSFVIGSSNRFAHHAALAVAEKPARAFNPLFIYGEVGLGKTHLLQAIGHYVLTQNTGLSVNYTTVEMFTNDFINSIRDGRMESFKKKYRDNDVLLLDDVQFLEEKERTQEEFFHTFNTLYEAGKQIVITSDRSPKELSTLQARIQSRFGSGLITDIQPPDLETRLAILRKRIKNDGIFIDKNQEDEVLGFIAESIPTNIRELEGSLIRVVAMSQLTNKEISLSLARDTLKDLLPTSPNKRISIDMIQKEVCKTFGLAMSELKGDRRSQNIVFPRQISMYLSRELTDSSLPQIGRSFGGRDHSTVIHSCDKISRLIKEEREVFDLVQRVTSKLKRSQR